MTESVTPFALPIGVTIIIIIIFITSAKEVMLTGVTRVFEREMILI